MAPIQTATSPSRPAAAVSTSTPLHGEEPTPTDLLLATPPAILKLLTLSAPVILALDSFVQLVTWTHPSFFASLLVLLSWWTLCLFGHLIVLYLLPSLLLVYIFSHYLFSASTRATSHRHRSRPATLTPAAYATLLLSAQDLASHVHTLRATIIYPISKQLSFVPHQAGKPAPAYRTAWIAITSYPFYLALTHFVPTNLIFLALGSVAILWNAPFFRTLRQALWRSAAVRWGSRIVVGLLSGGHGLKHEWEMTKKGVGIMGLLGRKKVDEAVEEKPVRVVKVGAVHEGEEEEDVQIQFTVFENQRWWVGLDWTHALLPGERASWCVLPRLSSRTSLISFRFASQDRPRSQPLLPSLFFRPPSPLHHLRPFSHSRRSNLSPKAHDGMEMARRRMERNAYAHHLLPSQTHRTTSERLFPPRQTRLPPRPPLPLHHHRRSRARLVPRRSSPTRFRRLPLPQLDRRRRRVAIRGQPFREDGAEGRTGKVYAEEGLGSESGVGGEVREGQGGGEGGGEEECCERWAGSECGEGGELEGEEREWEKGEEEGEGEGD